ncbi:MAG: carboxypeptidase regulatory-like domain-containing protein, partial [Planctomycetota bacterium]
MARRAWLFPIVGLLAAAMFLIFHKDESAPRKLPEQTRPISKRPSTGDDSAVALAPVGSDSRKPTEHERAGMRGSVSGTVLYTDGAPAAGLSVSIDAALQARTDPDGRFRFDDLKPGAYFVFVEEDELWGFHLLPGEQRTLDFRIPHSALVSGVITAADTLEPLDEVFATVQGSDGRTLRVAMTNKDGRFECRVPEGRHSLLVHAAAYQMQQLP